MKKMKIIATFALLGLFGSPLILWADQSTGEKISEEGRDIKTKTKKAARDLDEKVCEMVNGKMECVAKKVKNKAKNAVDKTKDAAETTKDKVD